MSLDWGQGWALGSAGRGGQREEVRKAGHKLLSAAGKQGEVGMGPRAHRQRDIEGGAMDPAKAVSFPAVRASKSEATLPPSPGRD